MFGDVVCRKFGLQNRVQNDQCANWDTERIAAWKPFIVPVFWPRLEVRVQIVLCGARTVYIGLAVKQAAVRQRHPSLPSDGEIVLQGNRGLAAGDWSADHRFYAPAFTGIDVCMYRYYRAIVTIRQAGWFLRPDCAPRSECRQFGMPAEYMSLSCHVMWHVMSCHVISCQRLRAVPLRPIWNIMVAAKLDHTGSLWPSFVKIGQRWMVEVPVRDTQTDRQTDSVTGCMRVWSINSLGSV